MHSIKNFYFPSSPVQAIVTLCALSTLFTFGYAGDFCGNKHKNLVLLQSITKEIEGVKIPEFLGIPTERILIFFAEHKIQVKELYTEAIELIQPKSAGTESSINKSLRLEKAKNLLEKLRSLIIECFEKNLFAFNGQEKSLFLSIREKSNFFMVRSTGIEDGLVANAGGNASIAYVQPNEQAIQKAMGEVIASYFTFHSLKNRIGGGEDLTASELCVPILIQVLIGESIGGASNLQEIPVSGVAYTTNQSLSTQSFKITEINAAYGHGEGVVANRVMADRYLITPSRINSTTDAIYPTIYEKAERLIPVYNAQNKTYSLSIKKNDSHASQLPVLSEKQLHHLHAVLTHIEAAYKQPMDIEFVILNGTAYIVQARPAMHVPMIPSYINFEGLEAHDFSSLIPGAVLVQGKAEVIIITDPKEIIVTKTIDEADQMENSIHCKAVFIDTWASSLSHAAVNFKTYGTPCLIIDNMQKLTSLLPEISPENPLIFDIQQKCVFLWKNKKKTISSVIDHGWLEHPIDRTFSLTLNSYNNRIGTHTHLPTDGQLLRLVEQLKKSRSKDEQISLLNVISERVFKLLALTAKRIALHEERVDASLKTALELYKTRFSSFISECRAAIEAEADLFEFLFLHKMLEAFLFQTSSNQVVLGGYTYTSFINSLYQKQPQFIIAKKLNIQELFFGDFL